MARLKIAYLIDAERREITPVKWREPEHLRQFVGGFIGGVFRWPAGDACYCDDEGLLKPKRGFFLMRGNPQPIAGNGIVVGPETWDDTADPSFPITALAESVRFMTREEVLAWGRAHAEVPAVSVTTGRLDEHGQIAGQVEVLSTYGEMIANMPAPPDETPRPEGEK